MTTWQTAWQHTENAVAFAAAIADLAIARHRKVLIEDIEDVVVGRLRVNRSFSDDSEDATQYKLYRDRYRATDPVRAVFALIDLVETLWHRPENRIRRIYSYCQQAGLDLFEVTRIELQHRFQDQDPDGCLSENHRLAFEAAWLAGRPDFAVQLVQRSLRDRRTA
jgi:hypothetical protein